jgi:hypothetical protein
MRVALGSVAFAVEGDVPSWPYSRAGASLRVVGRAASTPIDLVKSTPCAGYLGFLSVRQTGRCRASSDPEGPAKDAGGWFRLPAWPLTCAAEGRAESATLFSDPFYRVEGRRDLLRSRERPRPCPDRAARRLVQTIDPRSGASHGFAAAVGAKITPSSHPTGSTSSPAKEGALVLGGV